MQESKKQTKIIFAVIGVAILLTLTVGLSFAIYTFSATGGENVITTGTVSMSFTESTNVVDIANALPVQDLNAAQTSDEFFEFTVTSTATDAMNISYTVSATEVAVDTGYTKLEKNQVQLYLTSVSGSTETVVVNNLVSDVLGGSSTAQLLTNEHKHTAGGSLSTTYRLRMWIPYSVDASTWTADTKLEYKLRIDVNGQV